MFMLLKHTPIVSHTLIRPPPPRARVALLRCVHSLTERESMPVVIRGTNETYQQAVFALINESVAAHLSSHTQIHT